MKDKADKASEDTVGRSTMFTTADISDLSSRLCRTARCTGISTLCVLCVAITGPASTSSTNFTRPVAIREQESQELYMGQVNLSTFFARPSVSSFADSAN